MSIKERALKQLGSIGAYVHLCIVLLAVAALAVVTRWQLTLATAIFVAFLSSWAVAAVLAAGNPARFGSAALSLTAIPFLVVLFAWLYRFAFFVKHGGMDCYTCEGSPLVFLYQWGIESALLVAGVVAILSLFLAVRFNRVDT